MSIYIGCSKKKEHLKLPSKISAQVWDSLMPLISKGDISDRYVFYQAKRHFTKLLIDSMQTEGLDKDERIECASEFANAGNIDKALEFLKPFLAGNDEYAKYALKTLISIRIDYKQVDEAEKLMDDYRKRFPPDSNDMRYLYNEVSELSDVLNTMNRPDDAVRVILKEINSLPLDLPYISFYFVDELIPFMIEEKRLAEFTSIVDRLQAGITRSYNAYKDTVSYSDSAKAANDKLKKDFESLLKNFQSVKEKLSLIGKKAPEIKFAYVYNADSSKTFNALRGKVTILDFWTTWCMPCIIGFTELDDLIKRYGDKGLKVISITSFQGKFTDPETGVSEGSDSTKISRKKEIELTRSYIRNHHMTWPVVISQESIFNNWYHVKGIPAYFILDSKGIIRYMHVGIGKKVQMERVLNNLFDE